MAAAEARAAWQRTANRCFVQEDAKRAPKLACCQSSSSAKLADSNPNGATDTHHDPSTGFVPRNRKPSYSNLPSDMKWWLQLQPSYIGPQMGLTNEDEVESLKAEINSPSKVHKDRQQDSVECGASMKTDDFCYEPESPWTGGGKAVPWWHTTDKDELASLVALKSLDFVENCDLPPPQKIQVRRYSDACSGSFDSGGVSSLAWKSQAVPIRGLVVNPQMSPGRQCSSNTLSSTSAAEKDILEQIAESDPTKAELLEALCHSQTRAREAEKAAKQAEAEKEHVVKLVFKQASQLFAYKQWFQLLQLEALYVQIKNNEQPAVLPWTPYKSQKYQKSLKKTGKERRRKRGQAEPDVTPYAVALALGLSLIGAGLLLGWTVGWMLPF